MDSPYPFDLGSFGRASSTTSPDAQAWFDRGLVWSYAFNHEEAIRCFEQAIAADEEFGLAYWGLAYAAGPNYNKQWDAFDDVELRSSLRRAYDATRRAVELAAGAPAVERDLAQALTARYPSPEPTGDLHRWTAAYAEAMGEVYAAHPGDLDVAALYADALLNITAWALWDLSTGAPAVGARTSTARDVLESALAAPGGMAHPGLLHFYIHLMEMSPTPDAALEAANALRGRVPDAGHLLHMPSHIDVLMGEYERVIADNERAIAADERYAERAGRINFYALYRAHDHHFRIYGAMFAGRRATALAAAAALAGSLPEELLRVEVPPMADWLESFVPMRVHVLVRFGLWDEIIALPLPDDPVLYSVTTALTHYAKGVALAASARVYEAERERESFRASVARVPETRYLFNNTALDILAVAAAMLDGEIEYRKGNDGAAWRHLRRAVELDDALPYDEPWGWMQPTRHAYGALLLEQGEVEVAAAVYAADLGIDSRLPRACQHPNNVWSLHGYHECLVRLARRDEARAIRPRLDRALALADVEITSSCFCRLEHAHH
ncbi:MAG TPA: tetratricopeptide repeat protein [Solirubrobacteraceae bacterium]|nr:tetratricopeptide repeat protein [Solirubrobacteraceae bacterium]